MVVVTETENPELKSTSTEYVEWQSTALKGQQKLLKATFEAVRSLVNASFLVVMCIAKTKKNTFTTAEGCGHPC
jgi:hypothetical protein